MEPNNISKLNIKNNLKIIYFALKENDLPLFTKFLIIFTLGYALSPIDIIPDFIPILGYLDDIVIIPFLLNIIIKSIPENIISKARVKAIKEEINFKKNWFAGIFILIIWLIILIYFVKLILFIVKIIMKK